MTMTSEKLLELAAELAAVLQRQTRQLVLSESCTGGLVSALLTTQPQISDHFCGSAVVYQNQTKTNWLNISAEMLAQTGAVNETTAKLMVQGTLQKTPQADLAVSVTGHLGPNAPANLDGLIFIGIASAPLKEDRDQLELDVFQHRLKLEQQFEAGSHSRISLRVQRQLAAAALVLQQTIKFLEETN